MLANRTDFYPSVTMPIIGKPSPMIGILSFFNCTAEPQYGNAIRLEYWGFEILTLL
jgi:hypothetical protein